MKTNKIITKLLLLLAITAAAQTQAQTGVHFNTNEYFTVSASIDPTASYKNNSLDAAAEIEYVGFVYVKAGVEYFPGIKPSYLDLHGAVGINLMLDTFENSRAYGGIRLGRIFREDKARGELFGLESGIDYSVTEKMFVGLRATYDYRNDGLPLGWGAYWRASGFVRLGFKF
ncbi:hypothetical protein ACRASX_11130 [Flavobacterium sp. TMP13]|uniref:hypothetical protein n=1 Tax=Flavobacterium sp. TMP13 TaxID=3425950 RepID=UPI003D7886BC